MIVELLSVAAVFAGGCLLVRTAGLTGWGVPAFGLPAGVCLQLTVGLVQVVTPLPTTPVLTLAATAGLPAGWWLLRRWQGYDVGVPVGYAAVWLAALVPAVAALRAANLVAWHTDSFRYVMTGALLADGSYYTAVSTHNVTKRLIGLPVLHAPAQLTGEFYLRSIAPLLAVAMVAVLVWCFRRSVPGLPDATRVAVFATLAVLLLVSNNRVVFNAFYLNGHLLMAALLLLVAGGGWLLVTGRAGGPPAGLPGTARAGPLAEARPPAEAGRAPAARALMALQLLAVPALVVVRPEGPVMAGLALLPTVLSDRVPLRHRSAAVLVLGAATAAWQGFMLWVHLERGAEVPLTVAGPLVAGALLVAAAGLLRWLPRLRHPLRLLWVAEAGLWLALAVLAAGRPEILVDSVHATVRNLGFGAGKWGISLVVLAALVVGAIVLASDRGLAALRFPVTTFVPLGFLLAYLREEGAYRVGYGDSLSRMFMHIVPLAVLYIVAAYASADRFPRRDRSLPTTSPRGAR